MFKAEINGRIYSLEQDILQHQNKLELHAVWLFVATLSVWGVQEVNVKFVAMIAILLLYGFQVFEGNFRNESFDKSIKSIVTSLENETLSFYEKEDMHHQLDRMKRLFKPRRVLKYNPKFLICYAFWAGTMINVIFSSIG